MFRELTDLITFVVTEPFKIISEFVDDVVDIIEKETGIANIGGTDIEPSYGAPIYSPFGQNFSGHSGIYIGGRRVIALDGNGNISEVSLDEFTNHPAIITRDVYAPYYKDYNWSIGSPIAGGRALEKIGTNRKYHVVMDNCHQFCSGCLTGDFENSDNALWMLKHTFEKEYSESISWKKWKWR
jgi:hypothetical protein